MQHFMLTNKKDKPKTNRQLPFTKNKKNDTRFRP
jgi:hypothetical protein